MTPDDVWVYAIIPFLTMAVLTFGVVVVVRQRAGSRRTSGSADRSPPTRPRPWWGSPWLWIGITVVVVVLGAFVWVWLYALVLGVVPLVVWQRPARGPAVDPRTNGHAHRDAGSFKPE
jgi:ABC-type Fe3+ transport system permease subunit